MRLLLLIPLPIGNARAVRCRLPVGLINPSSGGIPAAVGRPVAVRYGWCNNPDGNLVNGVGLPPSPFRSDDWSVVTRTRK